MRHPGFAMARLLHGHSHPGLGGQAVTPMSPGCPGNRPTSSHWHLKLSPLGLTDTSVLGCLLLRGAVLTDPL